MTGRAIPPPGATGSPEIGRLAESITARLRHRARWRAAAAAVIAGGSSVAALEIAARLLPVPDLRAIEAGALALAGAAGWILGMRFKPAISAWRAIADGLSPEPGLFSAAAGDARTTALSAVVARRAASAATALLAAPPSRPPLPGIARLAGVAALLAGLAIVLPGRRIPLGDQDAPALRTRLAAEVRSLELEADRSGDSELARALRKSGDRLEGRGLTGPEARRLAEDLSQAAHAHEARVTALADALGAHTPFRELADAIRGADPAAIDRAIAELAARALVAPARAADSLDAAATLLRAAGSERDRDLAGALADAGRTLSSGNEAGAGDRISALAAHLRRVVRPSRGIRDVVVALDGAAGVDGRGGVAQGGPARTAEPRAPKGEVASGLPIPDDFRGLVRPGTSEEATLRRYFAVR